MALFAGTAAAATDQSLKEWRQLWMMEKEADRNYELAQQQMSFQADQQRQAQAFQERMARAQEAYQLGILERNELFEVSKIALDQMPNMTLDQQWAQVESLRTMGSPLLSVAENSVRNTLFNNFEDAVNLVDSVFTAPIGTAFNRTFVTMAADAVIGRSGMAPEQAEAFRADLEAALEARGGEADKWAALQWENAGLALDQARANVAQTKAQTGVYTAQEAALWQGIALDAATQEYIVENHRLINEQLAGAIAQQNIMTEHLPSQLAAELSNLHARTRELDNGDILFNRTIESVVRQQAAASGLAEEDLRHALATGMFRDAIVKGELDQLRAMVSYVGTQEDEARARIESLGIQNEAALLDMSVTRTSMLSQLVELGRGDLLGEVGRDLLAGLGIEGERADTLLASLSETANTKLSNAERREAAEVNIAIAEADFARWRADTSEAQRLFGNRVTEAQLAQGDRGLDIEERKLLLQAEGLRLEWYKANQYAQSLADQNLGAGATSLTDLHNSIKNGIGVSIEGINSSVEDYNTWVQADESLRNAVTVNEAGEMVAIDRQRLEGLAAQYGIDAMGLGDDALFRAMQGLISANSATTRARAEADTLAYIRAWTASTGAPPTASDLGFDPGDPVFLAAMQRVPGLTLTTASTSAVEADLRELASTLSPTIGQDGILFSGAKEVWDALVEVHGEQALTDAGYYEPAALLPILNEESVTYASSLGRVNEMLPFLQQLPGAPQGGWDLDDPASRLQLEQTIQSYERTFDTVRTMLDALPGTWARMANGIPFRREAAEQDRQFVSTLVNVLGVPRDSLIEQGFIGRDGMVEDRAGLMQYIINTQGNLAETRSALQLVDGRLRVR